MSPDNQNWIVFSFNFIIQSHMFYFYLGYFAPTNQ